LMGGSGTLGGNLGGYLHGTFRLVRSGQFR
jgi:hypothetical protein